MSITIWHQGTKIFPRLRFEEVASSRQFESRDSSGKRIEDEDEYEYEDEDEDEDEEEEEEDDDDIPSIFGTSSS
jgi:hypothetical protein